MTTKAIGCLAIKCDELDAHAGAPSLCPARIHRLLARL